MSRIAHDRTPTRGRWLTTVVIALVAGALIITGTTLASARSDGLSDLAGNAVALEPDSTLPPETVEKMAPTTDDGGRFAVPSVGLDVALGSLSMADGNITPPGFTSAYTVRNLGVSLDDAASGTVYVVMHSLRGGGVGPGNYLIDVEAERTLVAPGAQITVGEQTYTVSGDFAISKQAIQDEDVVWQNLPGRLVIITCLQRGENGPSEENIVITAQLNS